MSARQLEHVDGVASGKFNEIWATCWQAQRAKPSQRGVALAFDDDHVQVLVVKSDKKLFRH
ncbi:hypothetical protein SAMN05446635_5658 [Burkholderia sp. OK233]|nr:hypothetical protein SAMN05446635_5658 [Burkholderia sp. OK233]